MELVGIVRKIGDKYELDLAGLEALSKKQFAGQKRESYIPVPGLEETARKVLVNHLNPDGTIRQIPSQARKLRVILDYLVTAFTPGVDYTEKEVNTILRRFHLDTAGLRRDLVDTRSACTRERWFALLETRMSDELVGFFKALADPNRLKIVGLLAQKPYSVEELAALLELKASTVSHHLSQAGEGRSGQRPCRELLQRLPAGQAGAGGTLAGLVLRAGPFGRGGRRGPGCL